MTELRRLKVSLTKHGAHKVARLIEKLPIEKVLDNVSNDELNIHIDRAQAKKVLSVYHGNLVPDIWDFAKRQGPETINALTLISIIFSHNQLIDAFAHQTARDHRGTIKREDIGDAKAYTNLSNNVFELGYSVKQEASHFTYDFASFFDIHGLGGLVRETLELKLRAAGWDGQNSLVEEAIHHNFHKVFGLTPEGLTEWLKSGTLSSQAKNLRQIDDLEFLTQDDSAVVTQPFAFRPGHTLRKEGQIVTASRESAYTSTLLHNEIQNSLYAQLKEQYGEDCVGTEVPTGSGTSIDIVVKTNDFCCFYEIKTASTAKLCIRQAIPQLLEYAYWGGKEDLVDKLTIVSPRDLDKESEAYLKLLRDKFGLNLHYLKHVP